MKNQNETQINGLIIVSASLAAMLLTVSATISAVNATTVPSECQSHNGNNTNVHCTAGQKLPQQPTTLPGATTSGTHHQAVVQVSM